MQNEEPLYNPSVLAPQAFLRNFSKTELCTLSLFSILIFSVCLAWTNRFIQDDAFISFRYADNFIHGKGLIWNEGERVEGYTNFLWTMLMSIPIALGTDIIEFSFILGMSLFTINLLLTYKIANLILWSPTQALLVVFFLGTNYSFSSYATGGLETSLQTMTLLAGVFLTIRHKTIGTWTSRDLLCLSFLFSLALLTRLDSSIQIFPIIALLLMGIFRRQQPLNSKLLHVTSLGIPMLVIVGTWLIWKWGYYGDILPNTYYAKASSGTSLLYGIIFIYSFAFSYWLLPFFAILLANTRKLFFSDRWEMSLLGSIVLLWLLYVLKIGGGFMEYRFLIPILPFLFIFFVWIVFTFSTHSSVRIALSIFIVVGSVHHALTFNQITNFHNIAEFKRLNGHIFNQDENWSGVGKVLGKTFSSDPSQVLIATTAAGAIPFYSGLRTIDQHGLNDAWVAKQGTLYGERPGHQKIAPLAYLLQRDVNIVVGHPKIVETNLLKDNHFTLEDLISFRISGISPNSLPPESKLIAIPLDNVYSILVLYLRPSPYIDQVIRENHFSIYPILRICNLERHEYMYLQPAVTPICNEV